MSGAEDVDRAYAAADAAFEAWGETTPKDARPRAAQDRRRHRVAGRRDQRRRVPRHRQAARADDVGGDAVRLRPLPLLRRRLTGARGHGRPGSTWTDHTSWVRREPVGVVGQVTPWNYPLLMMIWKIAPALAGGNTVVLKPSDTTPASSTLLGELCQEFLPPGRPQRRVRRPRHRSSARRAQDAADGLDHRLGARGHGGRRLGRSRPQAGPPRARRQGAGDRLRRRRRREGRRGDRHGRLLQRRPGLHGRHPRAGRTRRPRRLRRGDHRAGEEHEDRAARRRGRALRRAQQRRPS